MYESGLTQTNKDIANLNVELTKTDNKSVERKSHLEQQFMTVQTSEQSRYLMD